MTTPIFPAGFAELEPFAGWALPTPDARQAHRRAASREEIKAFYDAALPRLRDILTTVDAHPLGGLPESLHPLYNLALSLAEVAPHVELYGGDPAVPYAFEETRFIAVHGQQNTALGQAPTAFA